jgi:hypothetical protein
VKGGLNDGLDVVKVEVRVDHEVNVGRFESRDFQLPFEGLFFSLLGKFERENFLDVIKIKPRVIQHECVGVLDENAVYRETDGRTDVEVPEDLRTVDDEASVIE